MLLAPTTNHPSPIITQVGPMRVVAPQRVLPYDVSSASRSGARSSDSGALGFRTPGFVFLGCLLQSRRATVRAPARDAVGAQSPREGRSVPCAPPELESRVNAERDRPPRHDRDRVRLAALVVQKVLARERQ